MSPPSTTAASFLLLVVLVSLSRAPATAIAFRHSHALNQTRHPTPLLRSAVTSISKHFVFLRNGSASMTIQTHFAFGANANTVGSAKVEATVEKGQTVLTSFKKETHKYGVSRSNVYIYIETRFEAFPGDAVLEVKASFGDEVRTHRHEFNVVGLVLYDQRTQPPKFYTGKSGVYLPLKRNDASPPYIELQSVIHTGGLDRPEYLLKRQDISFLLQQDSPVKWDQSHCKITARPSDLSKECGLAFSDQFDRFYILLPDEKDEGRGAKSEITFLWKGLQEVYKDTAEVGLQYLENQEMQDDTMTSFRTQWGSEERSVSKWKTAVIVSASVVPVLLMVVVACWCCQKKATMGDLHRVQHQGMLGESDLKSSKGGKSSLGKQLKESVYRSVFRIEPDEEKGIYKADTPRPKVKSEVGMDGFSVGDTVALHVENDRFGEEAPRNAELGSGETRVEPIDVPRERRGIREDLIGPSESIGQALGMEGRTGEGGGAISRNLRELGVVVEEQQSYIKERMQVLNMLQGPATRGVVGKHGERVKEGEGKEEARSSRTVRY